MVFHKTEVGMMKKYLYISILLGSIVLLGCTTEAVGKKEITEDSMTTVKTKVIENKVSPLNKEEKTSIPLNLTEEQKEEYYKKYLEIINRVNEESSNQLELEPISSFADENWVEIEEFEKRAKERANASIVVKGNSEIHNPILVSKTAFIITGPEKVKLIFEGSFETQLNKAKGRQLFSKVNSIESNVDDGEGSWIQTGYDQTLIDGERVYKIAVGGNYSHDGITSSHTIELEFFCDETGGVR